MSMPPKTPTPDAGPRVEDIPEGDDRTRLICPDCGFIHYENPKMVVGAVVRAGDRILLCRRAIAPRMGFWTLPAGYLELNEAPDEGARREAWEEAFAKIEIESLLAIYSIPRLSQVQLIYRARLMDEAIKPGIESQAVALFRWDEIPWGEIAFPTVRWALHHDREIGAAKIFEPRTNITDDPGLPQG
ncbi:MAG: NUDIX hydrolase [Alphaproteobacteria bacterium]|nr:NUDIX hydrolase [Alphaproteobacteria bacterium]